MAIKLPREGTKLRTALEKWVTAYGGEITFTQFTDLVCRDRDYGQWPTKCLKKYGRKDGSAGGRGKWVIDGRVASLIARGHIESLDAAKRLMDSVERGLEMLETTSYPKQVVVPRAALSVGSECRFFFPDTPDHPAQGIKVKLTTYTGGIWNGTYEEHRANFAGTETVHIEPGMPWYGVASDCLVPVDTDVQALLRAMGKVV